MAGKGAPRGNEYAKKERSGRTIGLYLTSEDLTVLEASLRTQGKTAGKLDVDRYARHLFKDAVRNLESSG